MRTATDAAPAYGIPGYGMQANGTAGSARARVRVLRPTPMGACLPVAGWSQIAFHTSADRKTGRPRRIGESP